MAENEVPPEQGEITAKQAIRPRRERIDSLIAKLHRKSKRNNVDWWKRASTIASILSSVVIASAGILITWSIQKSQLAVTKSQLQITAAQLEVTKQKNEDEQRQEETKLAADLFPQLLNSDPAIRTLAVTLLHHRSARPQAYDDVLAVLATDDKSGSVRKAAIQQLAQSDSKIAGRTIREIALDAGRPKDEQRIALSKDADFVYRIFASNCPQQNQTRELTGFKLKNLSGIVTALHGVIGCKSINAIGERDKKSLQLSIAKVDIARDAALLSGPSPPNSESTGLEGGEAKALDGLWMLSYPYGVPTIGARQVNLSLRVSRPLRDFLAHDALQAISAKGSPSLDAEMLGLEGHAVPGDSGAPLLNRDSQVVGFLDGSNIGDIGMSWGVPIKDIIWQDATSEALQALIGRQSNTLF
jgi:hypothetical protein